MLFQNGLVINYIVSNISKTYIVYTVYRLVSIGLDTHIDYTYTRIINCHLITHNHIRRYRFLRSYISRFSVGCHDIYMVQQEY